MCGITGYISLNSKPITDNSTVLKMLEVQKHRGPDDSGIRAFSLQSGQSIEMDSSKQSAIEGKFEGILGFNRLSILDLSINGHQPMASENGKVLLTLNGEIYNAFDLKPELEEWGYRFKSTTDTEVVLALYLKYGFEGMLDLLNGMFAIVVVDLERKEVFIARDRFGIKPMYYIKTGEIFAFSSELKSFKHLAPFAYKLDENQLDEFLLFRNNVKGTLFKDIENLDPGHYLSFRLGQELVRNRFFNINAYNRTAKTLDNLESYGEALEGWLSKSVQSQLMSDVKLGCQLSGGIDSSLVTWLANKNSEKGVFEAVSIIFNSQKFSEENYINTVTEILGIPSHRFLLDSGYYLKTIEDATWHLESPINHPNTIGIYKLAQRAKDHVTVLLSGEGADEVFGGYERFYDIAYPYRTRKILHQIKKNIKHPLGVLDYFSDDLRAIMSTAFMMPSMAKNLWGDFNEAKAMSSRRNLYQSLKGSHFERQVKYEMQTYLPDLLIRQDKMSMAHSIENRVPFLDNEVVKNSFTIPEKYLLLRKSPEGRNNEKYLLKKMTASIFGQEFAFRDKMGFSIPVREFFLDKYFTEYLNDKIRPGIQRRGLFNSKQISSWLGNIQNLKYNELEALWVIVSFEIWAAKFMDNSY